MRTAQAKTFTLSGYLQGGAGLKSRHRLIMRFARTLRRDVDAVRNAIELPWQQRPG